VGVEQQPGDDVGRLGAVLRVLAVLLGGVVLLGGQLRDTNDWFPLGSLSQYATPRSPDGTVVALSLLGTGADGRAVDVALSPQSVGLSRAEVESQQGRIVADPALLGQLAATRARLHPHAEPLRALALVRTTRQLRGGSVVGAPRTQDLARWTASP